MTVFSLKCVRCNKINCKKYYNCIHCNIIECKECLDDIAPSRLTCRILKDNDFGIEKTIYCVNQCTKVKRYCCDCGRHFHFLNSCKKCKSFYCTECRERNFESISNFFIEGDNIYNRKIMELSKYYCSNACFDLDHTLYEDTLCICRNCNEIYINTFNENECRKCLKRVRVDVDADYNAKRIKLQDHILKLINERKITISEIEKKVYIYMELEISKNSYMEKII